MGRVRIAALYALFAGIATLANLSAQAAVVALRPDQVGIVVSVLVGTVVGLPVKYLLDKRWIFGIVGTGRRDLRLFVLYGLTAVFTTVLFWGTEWAFAAAFATTPARLVGGALGLAAGYAIKYRLDKRFVFGVPPMEASTA